MSKKCLNCGKEIPNRNKYCDNTCQAEFQYKKYIEDWKNGKEDGLRGEYQLSKHIIRYLFEKYDNKCCCCGWSETNEYSDTIPLETHHIDGDFTNNDEENLQLLCPNCHSLTEGYKGANRGNGRQGRKKYYKK